MLEQGDCDRDASWAYVHTRLSNLALFLTEKDNPVVQDWHRDMAENYPGVDNEKFALQKLDPLLFTGPMR